MSSSSGAAFHIALRTKTSETRHASTSRQYAAALGDRRASGMGAPHAFSYSRELFGEPLVVFLLVKLM